MLKGISIYVFILLFLSGCGAKDDNREMENTKITQTDNLHKNVSQGGITQKNTTNDRINKWFDCTENVAYKGDFTFSAKPPETLECKIKNLYIGESPKGTLYQLMLDVPAIARVPEALLNIGFFFVQDDRIYRMPELSPEKQTKLLTDGEIPDSAAIVCQDEAIQDKKNNKKGWHERIDRSGDMAGYYRWNDESATNFYEWIIWKENVGVILYKRGYAAERDDITMWREEYVEKPHEFDF